MVLKLYGSSYSTYTKCVAIVLHEKNVPFELVPVDMLSKEHKSEEYLKKHPFGQVPYIDDDGFILFEARAISLYIATKYASQGTPLIPADLKGKALSAQAQSIEMSNFCPHAAGIMLEKFVNPKLRGLETDEVAVAKYASTLDAKLDGYERILSKQKYLAGNELTIADLFHIPVGTRLYDVNYGHLFDKRPNVKRHG
ncbi:hypothetical protein APHAL10511_000622 [Amanita phalloides]|nr:hypothetical protein APHAL10511_000622 [Amanita phalloides]